LTAYIGIYSNNDLSIKLKVTSEGSYLIASLNNNFSAILEAIGKDTFWGHGLTVTFTESKDSVNIKYDIKVPLLNYKESLILTREK
jgi:hypothetical protein